jgi:hypothetical protein
VAFTLDTKRKQRFDFMRSLYERTEGSEIGLVYIEEVAEEIHLPELETEIIALYLADEGLIRIRMRHIISITHIGVDEVETALAQPEKPTDHFPAIHHLPGPPTLAEPPAASAEVRPTANHDRTSERNRGTDLSFLPSLPEQKPAIDDLAAIELQHICKAIGLDPRIVTGEAALPAIPETAIAPPIPIETRDVVTGPGASRRGDDLRKLVNPEESPALSPRGPRTRARPFKQEAATASGESDLADVLSSLKLRLLKIRLSPDDMGEAQAEIATATAQLLSPRPKLPIITASLATLLSILEQKTGAAALTSDIETSLAKLRAFLQQPQV